jgi:nucleoside-diphosphate-sugar epimerase
MKILFVGECDGFSAQFIDRQVKEGNSVSIIAHRDFTKINKPRLEYKWYDYHAESVNVDRIFSNIRPQQVVFAGSLFGDEIWTYDPASNRYLSELLNVLNLSIKYRVDKFIFLSTTEVYKEIKSGVVSEKSELRASTYKGILSTQAEALVTEVGSMNSLNTLILRFSDLYGCKPNEERRDFLSNLNLELQGLSELHINKNHKFLPLHLSDAVEALYRCEGNTPSKIYNVSGSKPIDALELANMVKKKLKVSTPLITQLGQKQANKIDSQLIKTELEWGEFKSLEETLDLMKFSEQAVTQVVLSELPKLQKADPVLLHLIENVVFFALMASLSFLFKDHSILKNVDLMTLYIVSIALFFGIRQSILSIILTFGFYLYGLQFDFGNFIHIILNADTFLKLAQYIFMGVVVGYTVDQFKTSLAQNNIEKEYLENEYEELKEINDANVMIKHQYEKRLISYKTSLPRLYSITNQLDSLDPEILFSSIIKVLVDVLETDTVSVYSYDSRNGYARLIGAKNEESMFMGKSFKLSEHKELEHKLLENDIYIGNQWADGSPAMAGPIFHKGNIIAIILIKSMTFESLNLYQVNLLRTLTSLISSSFIRAYQYEEKVHNEKYLKNTEILVASEFKQLLAIKRNDSEQALADYTLLRLVTSEEPSSYYFKVMNLFRSTDYFGLDEKHQLHVLLRNRAAQDVAFVEARLKDKSIHFELVDLNDLA